MRKSRIANVFVSVLIAGGAAASLVGNQVVQAAPPTNKVTICHRTHSVTNPYVRITVSQNSVGNGNGKHGGNSHDQWSSVLFGSKPSPNVFNPAVNYSPAPEKKWGDIIPLTDTGGNALTGNAGQVAGLNYSGIGLQIYNGTGQYAGLCGTMNARDFYETERNAGVASTDVLADLNELEADEFASALSACGGTFTACNPTTLGTTSISIATTTTVAGATTTTTVAGATTTVAAGKSTTVTTNPAASLAAGKGGLTVKIWIDRNLDEKKNTSEPAMAGIKVTISGPGGALKSAFTDTDGKVLFLDLDPGAWKVVADDTGLASNGLDKTFDSDGKVDWMSDLTVVAGQIAASEYAAIGSSEIAVEAKEGPVKVKWAGPDGELNTDDDSTFDLTADSSGTLRIKGLSAGKYAVSASGLWESEDEYEVVDLDNGATESVSIAGLVMVGTGMRSGLPVSLMAMGLVLLGGLALAARRRQA